MMGMKKERRATALATLLPLLPVRERMGGKDVPVTDVTCDSRQARKGSLFVALRGFHADGHAFLGDAAKRGAAAAIVERLDPSVPLPQVAVTDTRLALGVAAAEVWGNPSRTLDLFGVTGTNGRTTVTWMLRSILAAAGRPCGVLGTLGAFWPGGEEPGPNTTPGADVIHRLLARMLEGGAACVAMEASSHAVALRRLVALRFRAVALTNVTRDHLDFHGTVESYRREKMHLFLPDETGPDRLEVGSAVLNGDDETGALLAGRSPLAKIVFGEAEGADLRAEILQSGVDGSVLRLLRKGEAVETRLPLPGAFNVSNGLAAVGLALAAGMSLEDAGVGLADATPPPGRMERVDRGQDFGVIIDYAHTPDGFAHLLRTVRAITPGRLILLFGCGGDRDRGKRPVMGRLAAELADHTVLTDDNPRSEDPSAIRKEVEKGLREGGGAYETVPDREEAIDRAVGLARTGDTVVLAGKGHEAYQVYGAERRRWNERAAAEHALDRRGGTP
ncbi:MAG: UDP-N-acetylmuramoyl-L-alanyl-D-glutamate--2,6-diaminopimelate ligase [Candidatus Eisenbacteria bacterium]